MSSHCTAASNGGNTQDQNGLSVDSSAQRVSNTDSVNSAQPAAPGQGVPHDDESDDKKQAAQDHVNLQVRKLSSRSIARRSFYVSNIPTQGREPADLTEQINPNATNHEHVAVYPPHENILAINNPANNNYDHVIDNGIPNITNPAVVEPANNHHNQVVFHQQNDQAPNLQAEEHPFDQPPAWYVALAQTFPLCQKCHMRHAHLRFAKTCVECLNKRPSLFTRRRMNEILHSGSFYCSSCLIRPGVQEGESCPLCQHMKAVVSIRRRLNLLLQQARERRQVTLAAVFRAAASPTFLFANREADTAFEACREAHRILVQAQEVFNRLGAIDQPKAEAAFPEFMQVLDQCAEATTATTHARELVMHRLALPAGHFQSYPDAFLFPLQEDNAAQPEDD